jgi:hypothetical protein
VVVNDAGDFVRFRAVCRPWRGTPPRPRAPSFLPWIVDSFVSDSDDGPGVRLHSPFSTRDTRHLRPLSALRGMKIFKSNASCGRVLAFGYSYDDHEDPTLALINPLDDGDATSLPPLPPGGTSPAAAALSRSLLKCHFSYVIVSTLKAFLYQCINMIFDTILITYQRVTILDTLTLLVVL